MMSVRKFVLNRDKVLRTTQGHSIRFRKGVPVVVPRALEREAVAIGAECVDGKVEMENPSTPAELSPDMRKEKLLDTLRTLRERNDSNDFTANGQPTVKAVERESGISADRTEVGELWLEIITAPDE